MEDHEFGIETRCLHAGQIPDPATGARATPLYQTAAYVFDDTDHAASLFNQQTFGNVYSRMSNPTTAVFEERMASLEGGRAALAVGSGMAAQMTALLTLLKQGDELVSASTLYGGSYSQFDVTFRRMGIDTVFVDPDDADNFRKAITERTKVVYIETIGNPSNNLIDIQAVAKIAHDAGIPLMVDNTFATPYLQKPLDLGADIVMHSATKYLGGHSDVVMGVLVVKDEEIAKEMYRIQNSSGAVCGPMDSFLVLRGIKTLHLRMREHCKNGKAIAEFLVKHPKIDKVYWPGLPSHPNHEIAKSQMKDFGGMVSFTTVGDKLEDALEIVKKCKLFALAESLGGVESLIGHPSTMTHAAIPKEEREAAGVTDSLIRLSVGIEDEEDLIADLEQALSSYNKQTTVQFTLSH